MKTETTQVLVIGSGIAGLYYAATCAQFAKVIVVTKGKIGESNTMFAQGGIAAVMDSNDSIENHVRDTLLAGDGLCNAEAVKTIAGNAKQAILNLEKLQVTFDKTTNGNFDLHREGGHSHNRIVHTADTTGREIETSLSDVVLKHPNITVIENCFATDLVVADNTCYGILALDSNNHLVTIQAYVTMLATGGAGEVYSVNTNPEIATGDGFAMAYRAGAKLSNMEFVQFHPTTLYAPGGDTFLITEALRGFGAELKTKSGEEFMAGYHSMKSLAPRDVVSRAIVSEMNKTNEPCVYLDATQIRDDELIRHFPNISAYCKQVGIDILTQMIPVIPAAHYMCGGVVTDLNGSTTVTNLYACGEVSCTGVHGANRLASNSLLEGVVFADRAATSTRARLSNLTSTVNVAAKESHLKLSSTCINDRKKIILQNLMWKYAGIIRNESGLKSCIAELSNMHVELKSEVALAGISKASLELLNMIETSLMIVKAALARDKSRGCHYRDDIPLKKVLCPKTKTLNTNFYETAIF